METTLQKLKISATIVNAITKSIISESICITFYGAEDIVFNRRLKR